MKVTKQKTTIVPLHVLVRSTDTTDRKAWMREYAEKKLNRKLAKVSRRTKRVTVRLEDINGPRGGVDKRCQIKVVLRGKDSLVLSETSSNARDAIDAAATRVTKAMRRVKRDKKAKSIRRPR